MLLIGTAIHATTQGGDLPRLTQSAPRPVADGKLPARAELGPVIPGLSQGGVPQGLAYVPEKDWLIVALDFDDARPSMLGAVNATSGQLESSISLLERDGSPHRGHVGGLAVSSEFLWVASLGIYRIPLQAITSADVAAAVRMQPVFIGDVPGSAATYHDGVLWIAEFVREGQGRKGAAHHIISREGKHSYAWITGYRLDENDNLVSRSRRQDPTPPDYIVTGPYNIQGLAFFKNHIILSTSYGRSNRSKLYLAPNPLSGDPGGMVKSSSGASVGYWEFSTADVRVFDFVPMAEGIAVVQDRVALITESGAAKYLKGGERPLDHILLITPPDDL